MIKINIVLYIYGINDAWVLMMPEIAQFQFHTCLGVKDIIMT